MNVIRVIQPGMLSSVQDLGRPGFEAHGVPCGGAFDQLSHRLGNHLLGNAPEHASIEMTMVGGSFGVTEDAVVCLTGADAPEAQVAHEGAHRRLKPNQPVHVSGGSEIRIGQLQRGVRAYLCVSGGIQTHPLLGSRSSLVSYPDAGLGEALREGAQLVIGSTDSVGGTQGSDLKQVLDAEQPIRIVPGAHYDLFSEAQLERLANHTHRVSNQSNRVGVRLNGNPFSGSLPDRVPSVGMVPGSIQVPPSGEPIVLGVDGPTSGGYPVIACVIEADLSVLAQRCPESQVRFEWVDLQTAWKINRDALGAVTPRT